MQSDCAKTTEHGLAGAGGGGGGPTFFTCVCGWKGAPGDFDAHTGPDFAEITRDTVRSVNEE